MVMDVICCFVGHRKIVNTVELELKVRSTVEKLIDGGVTVFLFGDHSEFNTLCYEYVTEFKQNHPQIRRIHYRTAHQEIGDSVKQYFIAGYEDSICPKGVAASGKAAYVERNRAMIRDSDICVFYYDELYQPSSRTSLKSGTKLAFEYALSQNKKIINLVQAEQG